MKYKLNIAKKLMPGIIFIAIVFSCNTVERDWEKTNEKNSIEAFTEFISKHPESDYLGEAKLKIELLEWEKISKENSIESYSQFIIKFPESVHLIEANAKIEQFEYELIMNSKNKDSLLLFVEKYHSSQRLLEITERLNNILFIEIKHDNNSQQLFRFLKNNPTFLPQISRAEWTKLSSTAGVKYSYKTFWLYQVQDQETGNWVYPTERVYYGEGFSDKTINANVLGDKYKCQLLYQDIARYKGKTRIPVFAYQGCPFSIKESLSVEKDMKFEMPITIVIDSATNNILWVSKESAYPFFYNDGNLLSGYNTSINTTWLFLKKGELFFAGNEAYYVLKDSAKIQFRSNGIKLNGLKKYRKSGN